MGKWDIYVLLMKKELMLEQLRASAREISRAVEDFKPYSKAFIGDLMEGMEQNHSDFMEELEKLLRALKDHKAEKAWEAAQYYSDDVMAVYESWEGTDATVAGKIKGKTVMMLSKGQAESTVEHYRTRLEKEKKKVRKNFEEMDLENVTLRDEMEKEVKRIESAVDRAVSGLGSIYFE